MTTALDRRRNWVGLFALYFAATGLMRALTGSALEIDQAEMLRYAQSLQWGYGPQPPLYAWLQWAVFQLTGPGVAGLFALKQVLLWLTPTLMLLLLSRALPVREAGLAALSLVLIPSISFDSQRTLTHAVLVLDVTLAFALVMWMVMRARAHGSDWVWLGVLLGLGFLAKPSFALVPLALIGAAMTLPALRRDLRWQETGLALMVAVVVCLGPAIWAVLHADVALDSVRKFDITESQPIWATALHSLYEIANSSVQFAGVALIVVGVAAVLARLRGPAHEVARTGEEALMLRWLWRYTAIAMAVFVVFTVVAQVGHFKERWLQTALLFLAPLLTLWLLPRLTERGQTAYSVTLVAVVVLVGTVLSVQDMLRGSRRAASFDVLAPQVAEALGSDVLLAENWLAGNILLTLPEAEVHPEYAPLDPARGYLFVWNNTLESGDGAAQLLRQAGPGWRIEPLTRLEAPYHVDPNRVLVLNLARVVPEGE